MKVIPPSKKPIKNETPKANTPAFMCLWDPRHSWNGSAHCSQEKLHSDWKKKKKEKNKHSQEWFCTVWGTNEMVRLIKFHLQSQGSFILTEIWICSQPKPPRSLGTSPDPSWHFGDTTKKTRESLGYSLDFPPIFTLELFSSQASAVTPQEHFPPCFTSSMPSFLTSFIRH